MPSKARLENARSKKRDEFYTTLSDIENEMRHYREHFKGATVLCNADDPFESAFFRFFALSFNRLGLKKLIATCYTGSPIAWKQFEFDQDTDPNNRRKPYKAVVTNVHDTTGDGGIDMFDVAELFRNGENQLTLLDGNGDFRSPECEQLLDEADIVVTNPPFSLFREYVSQLVNHNKKFIIIGNVNAISYAEFFPLIMQNKVWIGASIHSGDRMFYVPDDYPLNASTCGVDENGRRYIRVKGVRWFTNLDIKQRHEEIPLAKRYTPENYPRYDNYDAIEVSQTTDIPCDYDGTMGVPITFLDRYNPDQFEIIGIAKRGAGDVSLKTHIYTSEDSAKYSDLNGGPNLVFDQLPEYLKKKYKKKTKYPAYGKEDYLVQAYARILIRNKHPEQPKESSK